MYVSSFCLLVLHVVLLHNILRLCIDQHVNGVFGTSAFGAVQMAGTHSGDEVVVQLQRLNMRAEKATGEYNLLIREAFDSHDMMPMTSHGQSFAVPKAELNA